MPYLLFFISIPRKTDPDDDADDMMTTTCCCITMNYSAENQSHPENSSEQDENFLSAKHDLKVKIKKKRKHGFLGQNLTLSEPKELFLQ